MTSASSKLVSCGIVVYEASMLRAIVWRIRVIFSRRTAPKLSDSGEPGGVTPGGFGCRLGLTAANVIADVFLGDAVAGGADAAEVDAEFAGEAANGGAGGG